MGTAPRTVRVRQPFQFTTRTGERGKLRGRITFVSGDGLKVVQQSAMLSDAAFFIDPPYTAAGKKAGRRLYTHYDLDHGALFELAATISGDFLMTYENSEGMRELARRHHFDLESIAMKNNHHAEMTELLIGRDFAWARSDVKD